MTYTDIIGYIALLFAIIANITPNKRLLLILAGAATLLFSIHFYLIGSTITAITLVFMTIRTWTSIVFEKTLSICTFFLICGIFIGIFNYEKLLSLLPIVAFTFATIAMYMFRDVKMRVLFIFAAFSMLLNAIIHGSIPAMITETIVIMIHLYHVYKHNNLHLKGDKNENTY